MAIDYSACDTLLFNQLAGYARLVTAVKGAANIHLPDSDVDPEQVTEGLLVLPLPSPTQAGYTSNSVLFVRRWRVQWKTDGLMLADLRRIEAAVHEAILLLKDRKGPTGAGIIPPTVLAPLVLRDASIGDSDPQLAPLLDDPEGWEDMCDVQIEFTASREAAYAAGV